MNDPITIEQILTECRTIAVVGLSSNPIRPSYGVSKYMQDHGYRILPVNPSHMRFPAAYSQQSNIEEINGQLKKYPEALKYTYVDLFSHFLDGSHQLDVKYSTDGLHLNAAGYVHWVSYLKKQSLFFRAE